MKYLAKLNGEYINIICLTTNPFKLRNTKYDRDAICYTEIEARILRRTYPDIQFEIFNLYKRNRNVTRN
jgi:hypothetical protein